MFWLQLRKLWGKLCGTRNNSKYSKYSELFKQIVLDLSNCVSKKDLTALCVNWLEQARNIHNQLAHLLGSFGHTRLFGTLQE